MSRFLSASPSRGHTPPQHDAAPGSDSAQSAAGAIVVGDMDDATLESAGILAALTHQMTGSREAWDRLGEINAERRRRQGR